METTVEFKGVNYQEGCRYIALTSTAQECRLGPLKRVLPIGRHHSGTRPGFTGTGPAGATTGDQEQWEFPDVELTKHLYFWRKVLPPEVSGAYQASFHLLHCTHCDALVGQAAWGDTPEFKPDH